MRNLISHEHQIKLLVRAISVIAISAQPTPRTVGQSQIGAEPCGEMWSNNTCPPYELAVLKQRIGYLESEIRELKLTGHSWKENNGGSLKHRIADEISAIVGLREAITAERLWMRIVWLFLLLVGIGSTAYFVWATAHEYLSNPTATKVELLPQTDMPYPYPPIIICPDPWLDMDNVRSLGLSHEGLHYSLGYFFDIQIEHVFENLTSAKEDFRRTYEHHGFSSLDEYFKRIAFDLDAATPRTTASFEAFIRSPNATSYCGGHCSRHTEKVVTKDGVCYRFHPKDPSGPKRHLDGQVLIMKYRDNTEGVIKAAPAARLAIPESVNIDPKHALESSLLLPAMYQCHVRVLTMRYIRIESDKCAIVGKDDDPRSKPANYSPTTCYQQCMNDEYEEHQGCRKYDIDPSSAVLINRSANYCNAYDMKVADHWQRLRKLKEEAEREEIESTPNCLERCPMECNRTRFDIVLRYQVHMDNLPPSERAAINIVFKSNMTGVAIQLEHGALYEGGIFTMSEVETISFTSLVSNIGGALGLVIGGTMMTFVQIVVFVLKYCVEERKR